MHNHISILLSKEVTESFRTHRFLIWTIICGFFGILSPLSAYYMPDILALIGSTQNVVLTMSAVTYRDAVDQYVKNFTQLGSILMIFLAMGSVAGEKADGSLQFLVVRPITCRSVLCSKILAMVFMVSSGIGVAVILSSLYARYLFPGFPLISFVQSNLLLVLYLVVIGVMTISVSAMVEKPVVAGLCSMGLWLLSSMFGSLGGFGEYSFTRLGPEMIRVTEGFSMSLKPFVSSLVILVGGSWVAIQMLKSWEPSQ
ncbi:MAG: ABC transporter permease subunit [Sphaerochaetaceae bacterium]|jgi:ABC-2 type transport system permease protein|nr:ABC transporter permease subunit [Sphaerochaetaceae bacterium]